MRTREAGGGPTAMDLATLLEFFAKRRHPLRGLRQRLRGWSTGSRTHPWLNAVTRFAGSAATQAGFRDGTPRDWLSPAAPLPLQAPL